MTLLGLLLQILQADDLRVFIFPAALLAWYLVCWLLVGRDPKIENVTPQYQPPTGISPAVARYVLTGGADGTTLAAILAELATKHVISIQPGRSGGYRIRLLNDKATVMPEEAAALKNLLDVGLAVHAYAVTQTARISTVPVPLPPKPSAPIFGDDVLEATTGRAVAPAELPQSETLLDPAAGPEIKSILDSIQATFRDNLKGVYFRWNSGFILAGAAATLIWAMATAWRLETPQGSPLFLTFWLFFFTSIAGLVISGVWASRPAHPTPAQRIQLLVIPLVFFGLPGFLIYTFALPTAHGFVLALLCCTALNSFFFFLMRSPTAEGRRVLEQLAGFREFLVRVEQDRLQRLNTGAEKAELMNEFLPYAIALNVREGWGDSLAAAFSNAVVER